MAGGASSDSVSIKATLEGVQQILTDVRALKQGLDGAQEKTAQTGQRAAQASGFFRELGRNLLAVAASGLRAAGILDKFDLGRGVQEAKRFDLVTAKFGQAAGLGAADLRKKLEGLEDRTLTSAPALANFGRALGRITYDARGSSDAIAGLGEYALATGQDLGEQLDLGHTLRQGLGVVGDTTQEIERLYTIGKNVGTLGGPVQFIDTLKALGPQLEEVATGADGAGTKLAALVGVLGKGLKPEAARRVAGGALGLLKSNALQIEMLTGQRVTDDNGELIDPTKSLQALKGRFEKRYGKGTQQLRRALQYHYGDDVGLGLFRTNLEDVEKEAGAKGTGEVRARAEQYRQSPEAKREQVELAKARYERQAGEVVLKGQDLLIDALGANRAALAELTAGLIPFESLLGGGGGGGGGGGLLSSFAGGATGGGLTRGAVGLGVRGGLVGLGLLAAGAIGYGTYYAIRQHNKKEDRPRPREADGSPAQFVGKEHTIDNPILLGPASEFGEIPKNVNLAAALSKDSPYVTGYTPEQAKLAGADLQKYLQAERERLAKGEIPGPQLKSSVALTPEQRDEGDTWVVKQEIKLTRGPNAPPGGQ